MGVAVLAYSLASPAQAETVTISMKDRSFTPQIVRVKVGDTVQWVNDDTELHQVISGRTPYDKDLGQPMNSGAMLWKAAYAYTFATPGAYPYMCVIHRALDEQPGARGMVGEVIVTEQTPAPSGERPR